MRGMFTLRTTADLMAKLRHDHDRLQKAPDDPYAAFDFFVTAEHMPEWTGLSPGDREALRKGEVLLQVVSHIANGAKHFQVEDKRHRSVTASGVRGGFFPPRYFARRFWAGRHFGHGVLYVELDGDAAMMLGAEISAVGLADKVLHFWTTR
jgi:hypothetical protein